MELNKEQKEYVISVFDKVSTQHDDFDDIHEEVMDICIENDSLFDLSEDEDGDLYETYSNLIWDLLTEQ
jgi:hypothetical protein